MINFIISRHEKLKPMPDIYHAYPINANPARVFEGIATSKGLDSWWSKNSTGNPSVGAVYVLDFGPEHQWKAVVTKCISDTAFELEFTEAMDDWIGSKVGFVLNHADNLTWVHFYHTGWPELSEHYKISTYCWAMYLRILKRHIEHGESVPYEQRLDV